MRQLIKNSEGTQLVLSMIKTIQENKDYLSKIDGEIGDGDHGINMNKGFSLCQNKITDDDTLESSLEKLGNVLLTEIGGSMGPLYGMFFLSMKKKCQDEIDAKVFSEMLHNSLNEITELGSAKQGDKTILDTLIPAINAFDSAVAKDLNFSDALVEMDLAAEKGYKSTKDMIAKIGRASRLGERSRGVLDAGATSCYLLLHSMKEQICKMINL